MLPPLYETVIVPPGYRELVNEPWTENDPTTDWDFLYRLDWSEYTNWDFSYDEYVSPPTSILIGDHYRECYALSKHPEAQDLKAGRISSWLMLTLSGVGDPYIYLGVTGAGSRGIAIEPFNQRFVWCRTRYAWWQGKDGEGNNKTIVLRESWVDEEWVNPLITYHNPMTGSVNRVGVGATNQSINPRNRWDDTIIEKRL